MTEAANSIRIAVTTMSAANRKKYAAWLGCVN